MLSRIIFFSEGHGINRELLIPSRAVPVPFLFY